MVDHIVNKVIMITGAGGGFGRLVAEKTVARGAQVLAVDVDEAGLDALQESARGRSGRVMAVVTDVRDRAQMATAAKRGVDEFGRIDVLVNNAGVMPLAFFRIRTASLIFQFRPKSWPTRSSTPSTSRGVFRSVTLPSEHQVTFT